MKNQDSRKQPRISVHIECRFKPEDNDDKEYGALMLDLSKGGAFLSSTLLPPKVFESESFVMVVQDTAIKSDEKTHGDPYPQEEVHLDKKSKISITIEGEEPEDPLTISGEIRHSAINISEFGKLARFGIEFENTPHEFLQLLTALSVNSGKT